VSRFKNDIDDYQYFMRANCQTQEKGKFTHGLRLALSRSFLEQHRSELQVESRPEGGATVWFNLPVVTGP
jgi:signal transduction histidine kinase